MGAGGLPDRFFKGNFKVKGGFDCPADNRPRGGSRPSPGDPVSLSAELPLRGPLTSGEFLTDRLRFAPAQRSLSPPSWRLILESPLRSAILTTPT